MTFSRLAEISSLIAQPAALVQEAKSQSTDFEGIRSVIEDALADLQDKIEALTDLAKTTGAVKLDTIKDKDGLTVFKKLLKVSKDYKKDMDKLMAEAEAMIMQVAEGQVDRQVDGDVLTEGNLNYSDSADFTEDLTAVGSRVHDIKKIVRQPRWKAWMHTTDQNFDTSTVALEKDFAEKMLALDKAYDALEDELIRAE